MRPYFAVIKDSFREAWSSRVLWILLVLITLLLLAILPLGWKRQLTTGLRQDDIRDFSEMASELKTSFDSNQPSPAKHIGSLLTEELQQKLRDFTPTDEGRSPDESRLRRQLVDEMDSLLQQSDFYQQEAWQDTTLNKEARDLTDRGVENLSDDELQRLNRLALEAAFPQQIKQRPSQSVLFRYLVWDIGEPMRIRQDQLDQAIRGIVVGFISIVVGMIGVFSAILVTAPIIPNTFDSGSVSLLLSKPISRPLLFLAKFFGGCWYVLINAAYLIGGLWLLLGLRFDIWYKNLLLCIPIFLFLFIVYYSVSAFAGLVWRNTVVCVVVTVLFWFVCVLVGGAKQMVEMFFVHPNRLVKLLPSEGTLLAVNERGQVKEWVDEPNEWKSVFASGSPMAGPPMMFGLQMVRPVYDAQYDRLVTVTPAWPEATLQLGRREDDWERVEVGTAPRNIRQLLVEPDGRILGVTGQDLLRMVADPQPRKSQLELFGVKIPLPGENKLFEPAGPKPSLPMAGPISVALSPDTGILYILRRGTLTSLVQNENGVYEKQQEVDAPEAEAEEQRALLAAGGDTLLLARADGQIFLLDTNDLQLKKQFSAEGQTQPRFATAAPDGSWMAVLYHNRRLWLYDAQRQTPASIKIAGQGDISAIAFDGAERLLVSDRVDRVGVYQLATGTVDRWYIPPIDTMRRVYRYLINPLYTVFPKPSEMDNSINYLLTEKETVALGPDQDDLSAAQFKIDPWGPLWSSLAFVVVVLALSCLYIQRQDF